MPAVDKPPSLRCFDSLEHTRVMPPGGPVMAGPLPEVREGFCSHPRVPLTLVPSVSYPILLVAVLGPSR